MVYCAPIGLTSRTRDGLHFFDRERKKYIMGLSLTPTLPKLRRGIAASFFIATTLTALAGCNKDKELAYKEQSIYEIYSQAVLYLDQERDEEAAKYFDEVERQHPYSVWATTAKLMSAYAHYHINQYEEAITRLDRFIAVHPGNRDIAYAYYLKALCYYEQIADVRRDQEQTRKALDSLQDVITRFPNTPYSRDAHLKIDLTRDHLAAKEMDIGRYYLSTRHYLSAVNRFKVVVETYGSTSHVPEALHRLTEAYTALGIYEEAKKTASVLGYNFPSSDWYKNSYSLAQISGKRLASAKPESALAPIPPDSSPKSATPGTNPDEETERLSRPPTDGPIPSNTAPLPPAVGAKP
jgi:outer membrane protein assembly factor BamD